MRMFKDGQPPGLLSGFSEAPFFTRNKEYIEKNVHEPTDFIVLDHSNVVFGLSRGKDRGQESLGSLPGTPIG